MTAKLWVCKSHRDYGPENWSESGRCRACNRRYQREWRTRQKNIREAVTRLGIDVTDIPT